MSGMNISGLNDDYGTSTNSILNKSQLAMDSEMNSKRVQPIFKDSDSSEEGAAKKSETNDLIDEEFLKEAEDIKKMIAQFGDNLEEQAIAEMEMVEEEEFTEELPEDIHKKEQNTSY